MYIANKLTDMKDPQHEIGVLIGRFQLDQLHKGHLVLIEHVLSLHKKVVIFIGVSSSGNPTKRYPMGFATREKMIKEAFPDVVVSPARDMNNDDLWSGQIDSKIREIFHHGKAKLYGGRDSFIPHYKGKWPTEEIDDVIQLSSSEIREGISKEIRDTPDFRAGIIYHAYNKYPNAFQCVDIAPINEKEQTILLARKPNENKYRFIGGHVDPTDDSLEAAAMRELHEEAGGGLTVGTVSDMVYVTSMQVDDWRYRQEEDKIITALFKCNYQWGRAEAHDDIVEVQWFKISELLKEGRIVQWIVPEHVPLMIRLLQPQIEEKAKELKTEES